MADEGDWGQYADDVEEEDSPRVSLVNEKTKLNELVVPGDCLGDAASFTAGSGTYKYYDKIHAAAVGIVFREGDLISVRPPAGNRGTKPANPASGSSVIARVIRTNPRYLTCDILSIDGVVLKIACRGQIRATDVIENITPLTMYDHYRPGDVIRAGIITAGLAKNVLLTTQAKQYGVVLAECEMSGKYMSPVASNLMRCNDSKAYEFRKVAAHDEE